MRVSTRWISTLALCLLPLSLFADTMETVYFRANLDPQNEVPPITAAGNEAIATITFHIRRDEMGEIVSAVADFSVDYEVPAVTTASGLHIHAGAAGANGPVRFDTGLTSGNTLQLASGSGNVFRQVEIDSAEEITALEALLADPSAFYVNLHTPQNPGGFIRGQLMRMERVVLRTDLSPENEVPPIAGLDADGSATAEIVYTRDANGVIDTAMVRYDVDYAFPGAVTLTGLHIHPGAAGTNGPARLNTPLTSTNTVVDSDGEGNLSYVVDVTSDNDMSALNGLLSNPSGAYLNLHTTDNPGGAIRGQLQRTTEISYHFTIEPSNQVPPVAVNATGLAKVSIFATRDDEGEITSGTVVLDTSYSYPGAVTIQGFHIHEGAEGANGPVVLDSGITVAEPVVDADGTGNLHYRINVGANDEGALDALKGLLDSPEDYYLNLHTPVHPDGSLRAQLSGAAEEPEVFEDGVVSATFAEGVNVASPGSLISIFGTGLSQATGGAVVTNNELTTNIAGTEVRIGGVIAPLLYVSPTQINAQVPFEVAPGDDVEVVVSTPGGTSAERTITVSPSAPAVFAVVKGSDFSLIGPTNTVAPGQPVSVFVTGLGAGDPEVETGQLPLVDPLSMTAVIPVATIANMPAEVAASVFAPNLVGVYQLNIIVPASAPTGAQQLGFTIDGVQSNAVPINIQ